MSNPDSATSTTKKENSLLTTINRFSFWLKFYAILQYIRLGAVILVTLLLLFAGLATLSYGGGASMFTVVVGLLYGSVGLFFWFTGRYLQKSSTIISKLKQPVSHGEFVTINMSNIRNLQKYAQLQVIYTLITFVFGIFIFTVYLFMLFNFASNVFYNSTSAPSFMPVLEL